MPNLFKPSVVHRYSNSNPTQPAAVNESDNQNNCFWRFKTSDKCLGVLVILITIIFCIIPSIIMMIYLLIGPPGLPELTITSLSVSNFNFTRSNRDSGRWNLEFLIRNPNKKHSLSYDYVDCFLSHGESQLTNTMVLPFKQGINEQTTVHTAFSGSVSYVDGARVYDDIEKQLATCGSVGFDLMFLTSGKYRYHGLELDHIKVPLQLWALCEDLRVEISLDSGSGKMMCPTKKCDVHYI